jgi:hypothetical protein
MHGVSSHQQHAQAQQRVGGQELQQHRHEQRHDREVGHQQRGQETHLPERAPKLRHRHLQEGDEQHQRQRRVDGGFERRNNGHEQCRGCCHGDGAEVDGDLPVLKRLLKSLHAHV